MNKERVAALARALRASGKTPDEIISALGLDAALLIPKEDEMDKLSSSAASKIIMELQSRKALAMDADIEGLTAVLRQISGLEGNNHRPHAYDNMMGTMPNAGIPSWLSEHPGDEDSCFDTKEEEEEDDAADSRARDARMRVGRDETEEEEEKREEKEEEEAHDAYKEAEDARREAEDAHKDAEDRKRAEDRHRRAMDRLHRMGRDLRRRAEDYHRAHARDSESTPIDLYKPDTSHTLDEDRARARDTRRLGRDYRRARDAHRRAHDIWRRHADDWKRADDARKDAEDRRHEAEDAKREDDVKRAADACREAEDRMRKSAEDARRAEDALRRARDARHRARDARRTHDRHRADDTKMPKAALDSGTQMLTKAEVEEIIHSRLRDNDYKHRSIAEAMEVVRPKVGKIAMDASIQTEGDVYGRALDVLGIPHAGITQIGALKQIFSMAPGPGEESRSNSRFALDSAPPKVSDFKRFKEWLPAAANIERM